jgi:Tfp pilus assembly protein PilF
VRIDRLVAHARHFSALRAARKSNVRRIEIDSTVPSMRAPLRRPWIALLAAATAASCGDRGAVEAPSATRTAPGAVADSAGDPATARRLGEIAAALDAGRIDSARVLLAQLGDGAGSAAALLRARLALLAHDNIGALRELEVARAAATAAGRVEVHATAAELYCALGKLEAAEDEIRAGLALDAEAPVLLRARAMLALSRPGSAAAGLDLLERALAREPALPFTAALRREARLLAARAKLQEQDPAGALALVRALRATDPSLVAARELEAEALAAARDLEGACSVLEELRADGVELGLALADMHRRAGTLCLLEQRRDAALEHFARARELGATDADLGTGAELLFRAGAEATEAGLGKLRARELDAAAADFARAVHLDRDAIEARHYLAHVDFERGRFGDAAAGWRRVLEQARAQELPLPEPVHVLLARAYVRSGSSDQARAVLEIYLRDAPDGEWAEQTRAELAKLPRAAPAPEAPTRG